MTPNSEPLTIPAMLAAIGQITADRIRAAAGDKVTIDLSDLQLIHSYAYAINTELEIEAINTELEIEAQQKSGSEAAL